jgi:hypothetical protein
LALVSILLRRARFRFDSALWLLGAFLFADGALFPEGCPRKLTLGYIGGGGAKYWHGQRLTDALDAASLVTPCEFHTSRRRSHIEQQSTAFPLAKIRP